VAGELALARQRSRLRYGFVVTDKTDFLKKPRATNLRLFYWLVRRRLPAGE
jgi:hypothetical protein